MCATPIQASLSGFQQDCSKPVGTAGRIREQGLNGADMPPAAVRQLFSRDAPEQVHHAAGCGLAEEPGEVLCGRFGEFVAAGE